MRSARRRMISKNVDLNVKCIIAKTGMSFISDWIPGKDARCVAQAMCTNAVTPAGKISVLVSGNDGKSSFLIAIGGDDNQKMNFQMYNNLPWPTEDPLMFYLNENQVYTFELNSTFMQCGDNFLKRSRTLAGTIPLGICTNMEKVDYKSATFYIYSIRCWNNGILERDFVPAKSNGIYGLYDKVKRKFWRSSTGADFLGKDK